MVVALTLVIGHLSRRMCDQYESESERIVCFSDINYDWKDVTRSIFDDHQSSIKQKVLLMAYTENIFYDGHMDVKTFAIKYDEFLSISEVGLERIHATGSWGRGLI